MAVMYALLWTLSADTVCLNTESIFNWVQYSFNLLHPFFIIRHTVCIYVFFFRVQRLEWMRHQLILPRIIHCIVIVLIYTNRHNDMELTPYPPFSWYYSMDSMHVILGDSDHRCNIWVVDNKCNTHSMLFYTRGIGVTIVKLMILKVFWKTFRIIIWMVPLMVFVGMFFTIVGSPHLQMDERGHMLCNLSCA